MIRLTIGVVIMSGMMIAFSSMTPPTSTAVSTADGGNSHAIECIITVTTASNATVTIAIITIIIAITTTIVIFLVITTTVTVAVVIIMMMMIFIIMVEVAALATTAVKAKAKVRVGVREEKAALGTIFIIMQGGEAVVIIKIAVIDRTRETRLLPARRRRRTKGRGGLGRGLKCHWTSRRIGGTSRHHLPAAGVTNIENENVRQRGGGAEAVIIIKT